MSVKRKHSRNEDIVIPHEIKADLPEFDGIDEERVLAGPSYSGEKYEARFPRIYEMLLYE